MFRRRSDDAGAIAVLASIVIVLLLIPLAAFAITTHVREGAAAELQRAADAGALAGAASIPLGDLSFVNAYTQATPLSGYVIPAGPDPLAIACQQARAAMGADGHINDSFSPSGTTLPANFCHAEYIPHSAALGTLIDCLGVSSLVDPLLNGLLGNTKKVLPGLLHGGVKVTLKRMVGAPFDAVLGGQPTEQVAQAAAQRHFKNAVVLPLIPVNFLGLAGSPSSTVDLNPYVGTLVDTSLGAVTNLTNSLLKPLLPAACGDVLTQLTGDLGDLVNPTQGVQTVGEVINDAWAAGEEVMVLRVPTTVPILSVTPAFDFVPACLSKLSDGHIQANFNLPATAVFTGCATNAQGIFRASLVPVS